MYTGNMFSRLIEILQNPSKFTYLDQNHSVEKKIPQKRSYIGQSIVNKNRVSF